MDSLQLLVIGLSFILGLIVGSFLNVVGLRLMAEESIVHPPSTCPECKTPIKAYDNVPVISWILLGGQSRCCRKPISIQYPLVELATGVLFAMTVWQFGLGIQTLLLFFLIANMVVIFITDWHERSIYLVNSLSLIPAGLIYSGLSLGHHESLMIPVDLGLMIVHVPDALISALIAMAIAVVFFEGIILISGLLLNQEGFGHGDTHLMMGAGAYLGWPLLVLALFLGFVIQLIPSIPIMVVQWLRNKQYKSLVSGTVAFAFAMLPYAIINMGLPKNTETAVVLGCMLIAVAATFYFMKQIKENRSFTYLPLGPALVLGSLVALFYGKTLLAAVGLGG